MVCEDCAGDFQPSTFKDKCITCSADEYLHPEDGCVACRDEVEYLGTCDFYEGLFYPVTCFNNMILETNFYEEPICTCDYQSYIKEDSSDPTAVKCELCLEAIPNCSECEVVNGSVRCLDCANNYFLNS